jgi:modification methylase
MGNIVFDPIFGTGTSLAAAKRLGRQTFGCEISQTYFDRAVERLAAVKVT